jgi:hypothetical protein
MKMLWTNAALLCLGGCAARRQASKSASKASFKASQAAPVALPPKISDAELIESLAPPGKIWDDVMADGAALVLAATLLTLNTEELQTLLDKGDLIEVKCDEEDL